jgi:HSP20 family protein
MNELYDKVAKRAFSIFESNGRSSGHDLDDWLKAESEFLCSVPVELTETDAEFTVRAEVPGFTEKELEIVAEPGRLFITGKSEKKAEEKKKKETIYSEISEKEIFRSFLLPAEIDPEKVNAVLKNGVLEITMPKAKLPKKVSVMAKAA